MADAAPPPGTPSTSDRRDAPHGRIVTFYSYKGGTGRSMALANIAWLLAMTGKQVLVVDWDLEAPGLHRYFHPFLDDKELRASEGIIDWVIEFEDRATEQPVDRRDDAWYRPYANILRYAKSLDYGFPGRGLLDFIPAGRQSASYAARVNSFNWSSFYEKLGGWALIEEAKRLMLEEYEYVFVDSRTGVSDSAGICTVQLPTDLVVCYTLNTQSIEGASAVTASVVEKRRKRPEFPLRVLPVAMRVEKAEKDKRELRREYARAKFYLFLADLPPEQRDQQWGEGIVPYDPFYAYEELLAYFKEKPAESETILVAMRRIARQITGEALDLPLVTAAEQERILKQYAGVATVVDEPAAVVPKPSVYYSASRQDQDAARAIGFVVRSRLGTQIAMEPSDSSAADPESIWQALTESRAAVILFGAQGLAPAQLLELALARAWQAAEDRHGRVFSIIPVLLPGARLDPAPGLFAVTRPVDLRESRTDERAVEPLVARIEHRASEGPAASYSPYRGMPAFDEADAGTFFGRELIVEVLRQRVHTGRTLVLYGPRGIGKTSLVFGGLIPALRQQRAPQPVWSVVVPSDGPRGIASPSHGFGGAMPVPRQERAPETSGPPVVQPGGRAAEQGRQLYVVDNVDPTYVASLIATMESSRTEQRTCLFIVDSATVSAPAGTAAELPVPSDDDRRRIVERPASAAGLELEPGLVERIVEASAEAPLAALSLALQRLWELRKRGVLTHEGWRAVGPLGSVIDAWADAAIERAGTAEQSVARSLVIRLARLSSGSGPSIGILWSALDDGDRAMATSLAETGLVAIDRRGDGQPRLARFAHPVLLTHWTRLTRWLDEGGAFYAWRERIESSMREWQARPASHLLLTEANLEQARRWRDERGSELTEAERRFIGASEQADEESRSKREAALVRQGRARLYAYLAAAGFVLSIAVTTWTNMARASRAEAVIQAATERLRNGDYAGVIATVDNEADLVATDWRALQLRANANLLANNHQAAAEDYQRAIKLNLTDPRLYKGLAYALKLQGDLAGAMALYDRILGGPNQTPLSANDVQTFRDRAFARRMQGDLAGAIADYEAAIRIDGNDRATQDDLAYVRGLAARTTRTRGGAR